MRNTTGEGRRSKEKQHEMLTFLLAVLQWELQFSWGGQIHVDGTNYIYIYIWRWENRQRQERKRRNKTSAPLKTYHVIFRTE